MAICANCGKEIDEGAKFCTNCGAPVQHMQAPAQAEPLVPQDSPSQNINNSDLFDSNVTGESGSAGSFGSALEFGTSAGTGNDNYGTAPDSGADTFGTSAGAGSGFSGTSSDSAGAAYGSGTASYGAAPENAAVYTAGAAGSYTIVPKPSFMEAVTTCFKKYATFSGRARRSEYWYFALFIVICQALLSAIGNAIFGVPDDGGTNILQTIFNFAVLIPQISVFWRRMHDIGKKGTWFFLALIPVIGWIIVLIWECKDSEPGENEYGMSPKYPTVQ